MAIDTSMFACAVPAATYAVGDTIPMQNVRGPAVVRDGYGAAKLKRIFCASTNTASGAVNLKGHIVVKNSNWVDEAANLVVSPSAISLADNSSNVQKGHDAPLTPNSGWEVKFVVDEAITTTAANDVIALIDIDYPSVQAVKNPREEEGYPVSQVRKDTVAINAFGSSTSAVWTTFNVDILKAGSKYLLTEMGVYLSAAAITFVSISGAAGQQGLERIIPAISFGLGFLRYVLDYSTPLVKGPMNINYCPFGTAGSSATVTEIDWVKR